MVAPWGAFHVVGVDLELRLGVGTRFVGEEQVFVGLLGVGLLRIRAHEDASVEDALRFAGEDAVEILVTRAVRLGVVHNHVMVGKLVAVRDIHAVEDGLDAFTVERGADVVSVKASRR